MSSPLLGFANIVVVGLNADFARVQRYSKFFGPGVAADVFKVDAAKREVALRLITTSKVQQLVSHYTSIYQHD